MLTGEMVSHTGSSVVIARLQPPLMLPVSAPASSTTYKLHVPLGFWPLKTEANVALPAGAGD